MSKQVLINQIQDSSGNRFGQVSRPDDLMHAQEFSREHAESITRDYLTGDADVPQIAGFNYVLDGGLQLHVNAPGRIYGTTGKLFEMLDAEDVQINLSVANQTLARFDLIYALLEEDAAAAEEFRPFVRLRSQTELANGVVPYPPSQFNQPTELHNRATVMVRAGTAALAPVAPVVNANEVPLYLVRVNAGATQLRDTDVSDLRAAVRSLLSVSRRVDELTSRLNAFLQTTRTVNARDVLIGGGAGDYVGRTLQQYISDVVSASSENVDGLLRPEITTASGKLGSTRQSNVVDVPVFSQVVFGDRAYSLSPSRFDPSFGTNPRYANKSSTTEKTSTELPFSLGMITEVDTDGVGDFTRRTETLPVARTNAACAAINNRYVHIFGGTSQSGSALGDWLVYDTLADAFVERAFIGDIPPSSNRPFMVSLEGDTSRALLLATTTPQGQSRWFLIDPVTRQSEEIDGAPQGKFFIGDAVQVAVVFIIAVAADGSKTYWTYNGGFTQVTTTGQTPTCLFEHAAGCYYRENQFVLFENDPNVLASGRTYIFDYPSLTWSRLHFAQAHGGTESAQQPLSVFRIANVMGRPMIVGGGGASALVDDSTAWELTPEDGSGWRAIPTHLPLVRAVGFTSLLDDYAPRGRAFIFGGLNALLNTSDDVYAFARGGIVETSFNGQTAITLGADATFARFLIPDVVLSFEPIYLFVALSGNLPRGSVKLEYSFDGGQTFTEFAAEHYYKGLPADGATTRKLRMTLYRQGTARPVLAKMNEFLQSVDAAFQVVCRYDYIIAGTRYLYMDRQGNLTLEMSALPSTAKKCLLSRLTSTEVQDFINRRTIHVKYRGTQAGGVTPTFYNEIPVEPRFINAYKVKSDGTLADLTEPLVQFDQVANNQSILIAGLSNGESYVLEIGA